MQSSSNPAETNGLRQAHETTVHELNKVLEQAESLVHALGTEGGEALHELRARAARTVDDAKAKIAASSARARQAAGAAARRADAYVHENPWRAAAFGVAFGAALALVAAQAFRTHTR